MEVDGGPEIEENEREYGTGGVEEDEAPLIPHDVKKKKKRKGLVRNILYAILALVILVVVTAITTVLIILYGHESKEKVVFSFADIFESKYQTTSLTTEFTKSSTQNALLHWYTYPNGTYEMRRISAETGSFSTVVNYGALESAGVENETPFFSSANLKYIIFKRDVEKIWRHSSYGRFIAYNSATKQFTEFVDGEKLQKSVQFCPSDDSHIAYVDEDNNIFHYDFSTSTTSQVTTDGDATKLFNGIGDWVYEEDVLEEYNTMKFSEDCSSLAYMKINDEDVTVFQDPSYDVKEVFPTYTEVRYPVVGTPLPVVTFWVYDVTSKTNTEIEVNTEDDEFYIYDFKWNQKNSNQILLSIFPRDQKTKNIVLASKSGGTNWNITKINSFSTTTWFPYRREAMFLDDNHFIDIICKEGKDRFGIGLFDLNSIGGEPVQIFHFNDAFDVVDIYECSENDGLYFRAINSFYSNVYLFNMTTENLIPLGTQNSYITADFSSDGSSVVLNYEGPNVPHQDLYTIAAADGSLQHIVSLCDNEELRKSKNEVTWPRISLESVTINDNKLDVLLMKPPYFRKDTVYPVLIHVYGGPSSKTVDARYASMHSPFEVYMSSQKFIVATVDGRGTAGHGKEFMTSVYKQLGFLEAEDQIAFKNYLAKEKYVDKTKISIWGWSYGGFMTLFSTTEENSNFKSAVAVAPDSNHLGYDTAYTERYMGTIEENPKYNQSCIFNRIQEKTYEKTKLLLCHGMSDENVHPFNSYNIFSILQEYEVQFDAMVFPNKAHSILGTHTRKFLYKKISDFLLTNGQ